MNYRITRGIVALTILSAFCFSCKFSNDQTRTASRQHAGLEIALSLDPSFRNVETNLPRFLLTLTNHGPRSASVRIPSGFFHGYVIAESSLGWKAFIHRQSLHALISGVFVPPETVLLAGGKLSYIVDLNRDYVVSHQGSDSTAPDFSPENTAKLLRHLAIGEISLDDIVVKSNPLRVRVISIDGKLRSSVLTVHRTK